MFDWIWKITDSFYDARKTIASFFVGWILWVFMPIIIKEITMFDWIWKTTASFFVAWKFWSLVPIIIIVCLSILTHRYFITPKEYHERLAWEQERENDRFSQPVLRRWAITIGLCMIYVMSGVFFSVAIYKIFD